MVWVDVGVGGGSNVWGPVMASISCDTDTDDV